MAVLYRNQVTAQAVPSAETAAFTSPAVFAGVGAEGGGQAAPLPVRVTGVLNILAGTATTAIVVKCRQTSAAGTQVGASCTHTLAAGASASIPYAFEDNSGAAQAAAGVVYVITITQTAGTANGTLNNGEIQVES